MHGLPLRRAVSATGNILAFVHQHGEPVGRSHGRIYSLLALTTITDDERAREGNRHARRRYLGCVYARGGMSRNGMRTEGNCLCKGREAAEPPHRLLEGGRPTDTAVRRPRLGDTVTHNSQYLAENAHRSQYDYQLYRNETRALRAGRKFDFPTETLSVNLHPIAGFSLQRQRQRPS